MNATSSILSIGKIAGDLQRPVTEILLAVDRLSICPAMRINGIDHFDESDVEMIAKFIRDRDARK